MEIMPVFSNMYKQSLTKAKLTTTCPARVPDVAEWRPALTLQAENILCGDQVAYIGLLPSRQGLHILNVVFHTQ